MNSGHTGAPSARAENQGRSLPVRTCVGCRETAPQTQLVRLTLSAESVVVVDPSRRLGGRGAWLHPQANCLDKAVRSRAFARSFRRQVCVDPAALARELLD